MSRDVCDIHMLSVEHMGAYCQVTYLYYGADNFCVSLFFFLSFLNQHSGDRSQLDQLMIICGYVTRFLFKSITKFFYWCVCKETFRKMWGGAELESEHCPVVRAQNLVSDV